MNLCRSPSRTTTTSSYVSQHRDSVSSGNVSIGNFVNVRRRLVDTDGTVMRAEDDFWPTPEQIAAEAARHTFLCSLEVAEDLHPGDISIRLTRWLRLAPAGVACFHVSKGLHRMLTPATTIRDAATVLQFSLSLATPHPADQAFLCAIAVGIQELLDSCLSSSPPFAPRASSLRVLELCFPDLLITAATKATSQAAKDLWCGVLRGLVVSASHDLRAAIEELLAALLQLVEQPESPRDGDRNLRVTERHVPTSTIPPQWRFAATKPMLPFVFSLFEIVAMWPLATKASETHSTIAVAFAGAIERLATGCSTADAAAEPMNLAVAAVAACSTILEAPYGARWRPLFRSRLLHPLLRLSVSPLLPCCAAACGLLLRLALPKQDEESVLPAALTGPVLRGLFRPDCPEAITIAALAATKDLIARGLALDQPFSGCADVVPICAPEIYLDFFFLACTSPRTSLRLAAADAIPAVIQRLSSHYFSVYHDRCATAWNAMCRDACVGVRERLALSLAYVSSPPVPLADLSAAAVSMLRDRETSVQDAAVRSLPKVIATVTTSFKSQWDEQAAVAKMKSPSRTRASSSLQQQPPLLRSTSSSNVFGMKPLASHAIQLLLRDYVPKCRHRWRQLIRVQYVLRHAIRELSPADTIVAWTPELFRQLAEGASAARWDTAVTLALCLSRFASHDDVEIHRASVDAIERVRRMSPNPSGRRLTAMCFVMVAHSASFFFSREAWRAIFEGLSLSVITAARDLPGSTLAHEAAELAQRLATLKNVDGTSDERAESFAAFAASRLWLDPRRVSASGPDDAPNTVSWLTEIYGVRGSSLLPRAEVTAFATSHSW